MNEDNAAVVPAQDSLGSGKQIINRGKVTGVTYAFTGDMSARELKDHFKLSGLKGRQLTEKVNAALRDGAAQAEVKLSAAVAKLRQEGYQPDTATLRKNSAAIRFVKVTAPKPTKAESRAKAAEAKVASLTDALSKLRDMLTARGLTPEEIAAVVPA